MKLSSDPWFIIITILFGVLVYSIVDLTINTIQENVYEEEQIDGR